MTKYSFALAVLLSAAASAQVVGAGTVSGSAASAIDIPINFTSGTNAVSSLRFEVVLPTALVYGSTTTGPAATAAGKSATGAVISDGVRILIFGLNSTPIATGQIAVVRVTVAAGTPGGTLPVGIRVLDASDPNGVAVNLTAANGAVNVAPSVPVCGNGVKETGETCDPVSSCPTATSCNDNNACTTDALTGSAAACTAACTHTAVTVCRGADGCCPSGCNNTNDSDCAATCGNGVKETGETCDPASSCPTATSCNDNNACTTDALTGSAATCNAACTHTAVSACRNGDGCCPSGCNNTNDSDCAATCGNGVKEAGEACDPVSSCPTAITCNDNNACTADTLTGSAATCNAVCTHAPVSTCRSGDGCCPSGCNTGNDSDCSATCGNGIVEMGETCDPASSCPTAASCNDNNACTTDALTGSAAACTAACTHAAVSACRSGDGCCPSGCNNTNDSDCAATCGNGVKEAGETCDPLSSCPTAASCNDNNACTSDAVTGSATTCTAACTYVPVSACANADGCCPSGCTNANDSDCAQSCADKDGDGYGNPVDGCAKTQVDCNDSVASIHPGALETCNRVDDDCDGSIDEGFDVQVDPANCGACGNACGSGQTCQAGSCQTSPASGLVLYPPEPGAAGQVNTIRVTGATPGATVELAFGVATGDSRVRSCANIRYGIRTAWFLKRHATADSKGNVTFTARFKDYTGGLTIYFQAADLKACKLSQVVSKTITRSKVSTDTALIMEGALNGSLDGVELIESVDEDPVKAVDVVGGCGVVGQSTPGVSLAMALLLGLVWIRFGASRRRQLRPVRPTAGPLKRPGFTLPLVVSAGVVFLQCSVPPPSEDALGQTSSPLLAGDLNGDRSVTTADLQLLVNVLLGTQTNATVLARSDFDGNGNTDTSDLQKLVNLLLSCGGTNNACVCRVGSPPVLFNRSAAVAGVERSTTDVQLVDVDRDGRLDVVWASQFSGGVSPSGGLDISLNRGGGTFSTVVIGDETNLGAWTFVATSDVNRDGYADLLLTRPARASPELLLMKNQRDGGFVSDALAIPAITGNDDGLVFGRIAVSDIDRDGDPDLVVPVSYTSDFTADRPNLLLINDGTGKFTRDASNRLPVIPSGMDFTFCIAAGDVNGDGAPDLFLGEGMQRQRLLINNGSGVFSDQSDDDGQGVARLPATPMRGYQCKMFDADEDGDLDVVVVNDVNATATGNETMAPQLFTNNGRGYFTLKALPTAPGGPYDTRGVATGDVNGDRIPDLVFSQDKFTVSHNGHAMTLLLGQCDGGYAYAASGLPSSDQGVHGVAVGDVDGDGKLDVVGAVPTKSDGGSYANIFLRSQ